MGWLVRHGVGRDHAGSRDDEHRLVIAVAEEVNVVGAVDLRHGDGRPLRLRRRGSRGRLRGKLRKAEQRQRAEHGDDHALHGGPP
jgi:hypothetical protein